MSSSGPPLKPWTELPEALRDLPRRGFVRRPPETHEESLHTEVIFGVDDLGELLEQAEKRAPASAAPLDAKTAKS
jgi:hypothetical protein